jgi:hypothetical protein
MVIETDLLCECMANTLISSARRVVPRSLTKLERFYKRVDDTTNDNGDFKHCNTIQRDESP